MHFTEDELLSRDAKNILVWFLDVGGTSIKTTAQIWDISVYRATKLVKELEDRNYIIREKKQLDCGKFYWDIDVSETQFGYRIIDIRF